MVTCSLCLFDNSPDSAVCTRCGQYLSATGAAATLVDRVRSDAPETVEREIDDVITPTPRPAARKSAVVPQPGSVLTKGLPDDVRSPRSSAVTAAATARESLGDPRRGERAVQPRLVVVRGERLNASYLVLEGRNYIGRSADKPVDIDLDGQEPVERVWASRQHAVITWDRGVLGIEDLNSLNGTFVNRIRIHPGQRLTLQANDIIQIGTVQLKVVG